MAEKKKMSVADILAAARKADGGAGSSTPEPAAAAESAAAKVADTTSPAAEEAVEAQSVEEPASAKAKPALKPGERPSIADILAMARTGDKAGGAKPAAAPKPKAEAKPAAKPAAAASPKAPAAKAGPAKPAVAARPNTASILAAARGGAKPGPITKAEAAQKDTAKPKAAAAPKLAVPPMPEKPAYAALKPGTKPVAAVAVASPKAVPGLKKGAAPDQGRRATLLGMVAGTFGVLFGSFLATGFTALTGTATLWTLAVARFMFPNILTEPPSRFKIGFPDEFPPGQVNEKFKSQFGVWVVNYEYHGSPEIYALSTVCTHLGCTPNWLEAEQKFKCPCHGSGFYKDGINFEGPAPRPLERYSVRIAEDGQLEIDKSHKFQEELGQWEDPTSYVHV